MRPGLVGYFDIGESYGLGDEVFPRKERAPLPDIGMVGIQFPLGAGLRVDLLRTEARAAAAWREAAAVQARRPEMETGWTEDLGVSREEFDRELHGLITNLPMTRCEMHVHAVGTVYAELQFGNGAPVPYIHGLLACFEFAAYTPEIADSLWEAAHERAEAALGPRLTGLVPLSKRALKEVVVDSRGYEERQLFTAFTKLIACVDDGDEDELVDLKTAFEIELADVRAFDDHGTLYYGWSACVLEPRQWDEPIRRREQRVLRIEADIRVAHVFHGTCEAFTGLFVSEIHEQVGGYVAGEGRGRSPQELNRLRALALAVVNLTDFDKVTLADEDHVYFREFSHYAGIERKQRAIQDATNVLYDVQAAELQREVARRQTALNWIALLLASLSLISVGAVGYDFIRDDASLIDARGERALVFALFNFVVIVLVTAVMLTTREARRR